MCLEGAAFVLLAREVVQPGAFVGRPWETVALGWALWVGYALERWLDVRHGHTKGGTHRHAFVQANQFGFLALALAGLAGLLFAAAPDFAVVADADRVFKGADAVIDFSVAGAVQNHAALAAKHGTPLVIGTSGISADQQKAVADAAQKVAIVQAANMSVGVNLVLGLTEQVARILGPEYDVEILELFHRKKVDAPSGTSLALGRAAARARGVPTLRSLA